MKKVIVLIGMCVLLLSIGHADADGWDRTEIRPERLTTSEGLVFSVSYLYRREGRGEIEALTNQSTLREGDLYKLFFMPQERSYVYIFQVDSSGKIEQLFPMSSFTGLNPENVNPVTPGKRYDIPGQDKSFELVAQTGLHSIYFLGFRQANTELEERYQEMLIAQLNHNPMRLRIVQKKFQSLFDTARASAVIPTIQIDTEPELFDDSTQVASALSYTERQIMDALSVKPLSTKGIPQDIHTILQNNDMLTGFPKRAEFIRFYPGTATLEPGSHSLLSAYGRVLQDRLKDSLLLLAGHADEERSLQRNLELSRQRVEAVRAFLMTNYEISKERLLVKAYGASQAVSRQKGSQENNRIEFIRLR